MMMPNQPGMGGPAPAPMGAPAPGGAPMSGGYPSGDEVMQDRQTSMPDANVDNPVIAGFRTIVQLIGVMKQKGDPRADKAIGHLQGLIQTLSGGDLPMDNPMPPPPMSPPPQPAGPDNPAPMPGAPMPGAPAPMPGAPAPMGAEPPMPEMAFDPFAPKGPTAAPKQMPMGGKPQAMPGKQPKILT